MWSNVGVLFTYVLFLMPCVSHWRVWSGWCCCYMTDAGSTLHIFASFLPERRMRKRRIHGRVRWYSANFSIQPTEYVHSGAHKHVYMEKKIRCDLTNNPADTSEDISKIDFMCSHGLSLDWECNNVRAVTGAGWLCSESLIDEKRLGHLQYTSIG